MSVAGDSQYKILKVKAILKGWLPEYEALCLPGGLFGARFSVSILSSGTR